MSNYDFLQNAPKKQVLLLVEGIHEKKVFLKLLLDYFPEMNISMCNVHIYNTDIYDLYHSIEKEYGEKWYEERLSIDLPCIISERNDIVPKLERKYFSDVILIFDYEHHDNFFSEDKIIRMQEHFSNSSEDGILYINYPMIESYYHMTKIPDEQYDSRVSLTDLGKGYKNVAREHSVLLQYINIQTKIEQKLKELLGEIKGTELVDIIFQISDKHNIQQVVFDFIVGCNNGERVAYQSSRELDSVLSQLGYWTEEQTFSEKMRQMIVLVVAQNISKAWKLQGEVLCDNLKKKYQMIDLKKVLYVQNEASARPENGIIWILCTSLFILSEYKFFWREYSELETRL